jgi:hypothetical protein
MRKADEIAASVAFVTHLRLFGEVYSQLKPDYFWQMPNPSGALIMPAVPTALLQQRRSYPGDIDLLVIPFEGNELVLEHVMAIEVKVIRATFDKEGKSPNEFGFSQAEGLLQLGFPYVAVAHLIVSGDAPVSTWKEAMTCRVLDSSGRAGEFYPVLWDMLPARLIDRAFGRLVANCRNQTVGLAAAHVGRPDLTLVHGFEREARWVTAGRQAGWNENANRDLLRNIVKFYLRNDWRFLALPRHDPPTK